MIPTPSVSLKMLSENIDHNNLEISTKNSQFDRLLWESDGYKREMHTETVVPKNYQSYSGP